MPGQEGQFMNNAELDKLLKSTPAPDRAPALWEALPKRIMARLHWQTGRETISEIGSRQFVPLAWAFGSIAMCAVIALAFFALRQPAEKSQGGQMAGAEKCYREIESLFPNQIQSIVFDETGSRIVLAEKADVPASTPLYLKICGPRGCQQVVTFSGQQIRVNGETCDVLADAAGHVLLVGKRLVWSSASLTRQIGPYRIEARSLEAAS
jgi:hypothetical protein